MSIQVIARVLPKRWGSPSRKIVALKLADVAREDGTKIYPSISTVAAESELSERQVQRVMDEFRKEGLLVVVRKGGGRYRTNEYRFDLPTIEMLPDARPLMENETVVALGKGDMVSPFSHPDLGTKGDMVSGKGDMVSPNPSLPVSILSSKEETASDEAGAEAPSVSAKVWKEGRELLNSSPSKPLPSIIGKWLKRTPSSGDKEILLRIIRAAKDAGTGDPVAYVSKAVERQFPPLPEPNQFDQVTWQRNCQAAIKTKQWSEAWGPPPGKKGCLLPTELITDQLTQALSERRIAA